MFKFIKSAAAISLACGLVFSASAENKSEIVINPQGLRTVTVAYGDLDLTTSAGQETLSSRVKAAVRKVCGDTNARQTVSEMRDHRICTTRASESALASFDKETRTRIAANF